MLIEQAIFESKPVATMPYDQGGAGGCNVQVDWKGPTQGALARFKCADTADWKKCSGTCGFAVSCMV